MTGDVRPLCFIERCVPGGDLLSAAFFGVAHTEVVVRGDGVAEGVEREPRLQILGGCAIKRSQAQARGQELLPQILQAFGLSFRRPGFGTLVDPPPLLWINQAEAYGTIAETILSGLPCGRRWITHQEAELGDNPQERMNDGSHV